MGRAQFSSKRGGGRGGGNRRGRGGRGRRGERSGPASSSPWIDFRAPGYNDGVPTSVNEHDVGIRIFLNPDVKGFQGTIKERFSDFIVQEIAWDGHVVRLTDVAMHEARKKPREMKISDIFKQRVLSFLDQPQMIDKDATDNGDADGAHRLSKMNIPPQIYSLVGTLAGRVFHLFKINKREAAVRKEEVNVQKLRDVVTGVADPATADELVAFLNGILKKTPWTINENEKETPGKGQEADNEPVFHFPNLARKEDRLAIHNAIRTFGANLIVSDTVTTEAGNAVIRVRPMHVNGRKRRDLDKRLLNKWPSDRPDFLQFVLYKRNMDTSRVMASLAKAMNLNVSCFSYAGTKDKRGVTTQLCTVYRGSKEKLDGLNKGSLEKLNFVVGNARYVKNKLTLGDLKGNRFTLAIRNLPCETEISDDEVKGAVKQWAQHGFINYFGLQRFGTKSIATHEVGRAILRRNYQMAVELLLKPQKGDASKIYEARQQFMETKDVEAAMRSFPPYLIAERAVLEGLQNHGGQAYPQAIQCIPRYLRMMYTHAYQSYVWNTVVSERLEKYSKTKPIVGDLVIQPGSIAEDVAEDDAGTPEVVEEPQSKRRKVEKLEPIVVDESNIDQFSIFDVVLPMPGYSIKYPENALKETYEKILAEDEVDFHSLSRATNVEYHLPGSYRHIVNKPLDVSCEIKQYDDPTASLLQTDVDRILGVEAAKSIPGAKHRALCLNFHLSPSSYATMAVRELMKQSSSLDVQFRIMQE